jgi:hypothetical protein
MQLRCCVRGGTWIGVACWWYLPSHVNQLDGPMLHVQITSGSPICGGGIPVDCGGSRRLVVEVG